MQSKRATNANQPALIPIAGNFDRKPRYLDREVTTIGRARGTDLCLEANEISTLHCVIYRTAEGYRIRDCNSRCGTRINGDSVKGGSSLLHDADIVNLGPFSFEFRMPPALFPDEGKRIDPVKVQHLQNSRRRLAMLALKMRKRAAGTSPREQEWQQKGHLLKEKIRCYDQRSRELEAAEEELDAERNQLVKETERHKQHVQSIEGQIAERLAEAEKQIHARWQDFQQRCQAEEARRPATEGGVDAWAVNKQQLQREQQEFANMKEQWVQDQTKAAIDLEAQHSALAQKRADLLRLMSDLKKMQEDLRKQAKPDVRELQGEVERLQRENAELRGSSDDGAANELHAALITLRDELDEKDKILNDLIDHAGTGTGTGAEQDLRAENELLKKLLEEKDRVVEELTQQPKPPKNSNDLERYETELNDFRRQLEDDRNKLNKEVETLRERNKELEEAIREVEMEMSKERAELARERMRLERVREEVKADTERLQREVAVRDSMAPVQKLRDEIAAKQPGAKGEKPGMRTMSGS